MSQFRKIAICFLCAFCCFNSARADMDFLSKLSFSDKKYAKNIEVQTYLVTKDQVAEVFSREKAEVAQKVNQDLYGQEVSLV